MIKQVIVTNNEYDIPFVVTLYIKNTYAVLRVHVIKIEGQPYVLLQLEPLTNQQFFYFVEQFPCGLIYQSVQEMSRLYGEGG